MTQYVSLAATAWFMGFFPLTDIHIAIPSAMAFGLGTTSAIFWSSFGSFISIPIISYFYDQLSRIKIINMYFQKLSNSKFCCKMKEKSIIFILLTTPIVGSWTIGVLGKIIGIDRGKLFIASGLSIVFYSLLIGFITSIGFDVFFNSI